MLEVDPPSYGRLPGLRVWVSFAPMRGVLHALRAAATFAVAIPVTVLVAAAVIAIAMKSPTSSSLDRVLRIWGRTWCWAAGVELVVEGLEHIEADQLYVVVSNHPSNFDTLAYFAVLPVPIRFLAKTELFKIPIFGMAMRKLGMVEVNRGSGRAAYRAIIQGARKIIEHGWSLMVYPEGTRSRDGVTLGFKKGAFSIARNLKAPILPTAISGSRAVWKPNSKLIRPGKITIKIMPPIPTEGMMTYELDGLRNLVHAQITEAVEHPAVANRTNC